MMRTDYSAFFLRQYHKAPEEIRQALRKQVSLLLENLRHPSLHAKKYDEHGDILQARVSRDWRFYFQIKGDTYYLLKIIQHPK